MTFTSSMAQAWVEFRLRSIDLAKSEDVLDKLYSTGLADLNRLIELSLIDADEYQVSLKTLQQEVKDQRTFLRALETA